MVMYSCSYMDSNMNVTCTSCPHNFGINVNICVISIKVDILFQSLIGIFYAVNKFPFNFLQGYFLYEEQF